MLKKILLSILTLTLIILLSIISMDNYNQSQNIKNLLEQNLDGRLIPHKINYKNKLHNILNDNLHSFEFDIMFNAHASTPFFEIGHDDTETHGASFEDYLKIIKDKKIQDMDGYKKC